MKKLLVILIAAISFNGLAIAAGSPSLVKSTDKSFAVYFDDWNEADLTVQIKDNQGFILMTDKVKDEHVTGKKYNLKNLPQGDYTLEIGNGQKVMTQAISLTDTTVAFDEDKSKVYYNPTIVINEDKMDFNLLSLGKDVSVDITDASGESIYNTVFGTPQAVNERFDLSQLQKGEYTISVVQDEYKHRVKFVL